MQGYNILLIQDEMQRRIDELENALEKLCTGVESSKLEPPKELGEAKTTLLKQIKRRGGNLPYPRRY